MMLNITPENCTSLNTLKYIIRNSLSEIYPNMIIALKVLPTIPITVASVEQSFSKLKLLKKVPLIGDYS